MEPSELLSRAIDARSAWLSTLGPDTDCVRLLHGAAEGMPGLAVDRYGPILLVQTWREPLPAQALDGLHRVAEQKLETTLVPVWNHRAKAAKESFDKWHRPTLPAAPIGLEHGLRFDVRPRHRGIDPLLFLDFRVARRRVRAEAAGRSVLNLFAYTCGIGVAVLAGGATEVLNVDFAASALKIGQENARRNQLEAGFEVLREDVFPVVRQLAGLGVGGRAGRRPPYQRVARRTYDLVVLDPPRWAKTRWGAVDVVRDYPSLFKPALLATAPGGRLLATNNAAQVDLQEWLDTLHRSARKAGRPIRSAEVLTPDSDVPSFDGRHPLKLAWLEV